MKLVVGLGNPGPKYRNHRHNVGFRVVDEAAVTFASERWKERFEGMAAECAVGQERVLLLKPATYMNASGRSVRRAVDFYKLALENVLVVCDDFQLPLGSLRIRTKGSSGGQKGLEDTLSNLGTEDVARLRIGIGPTGDCDPVDYVLSDFPEQDLPVIAATVKQAVRAIETWCREGASAAMNRFNTKQSTKE
jgi:PTH1 family peptidyl-tRNA hydrolase